MLPHMQQWKVWLEVKTRQATNLDEQFFILYRTIWPPTCESQQLWTHKQNHEQIQEGFDNKILKQEWGDLRILGGDMPWQE
jgi:hypothetical protein